MNEIVDIQFSKSFLIVFKMRTPNQPQVCSKKIYNKGASINYVDKQGGEGS